MTRICDPDGPCDHHPPVQVPAGTTWDHAYSRERRIRPAGLAMTVVGTPDTRSSGGRTRSLGGNPRSPSTMGGDAYLVL